MDGQISYLEVQETNIVIDFCTRLLQLYSSHNIGKVQFWYIVVSTKSMLVLIIFVMHSNLLFTAQISVINIFIYGHMSLLLLLLHSIDCGEVYKAFRSIQVVS